MHQNNIINAAIQIVPLNVSKGSYDYIDAAISVIKESGLHYSVTPFETVIEGPERQVLDVLDKARQSALEAGAEELLVNIKLHLRKSQDVTFEEKIARHSI